MFKKFLCLFLLLPFSFLLSGQCMTVPESLENLVAASPLVLEGKVRSQESFYDIDGKNIYTVNEIEIFKTFKSVVTLGTVHVVTNGGVVGLEMDRVSNALELQIGDIGIFMLNAFPNTLAGDLPVTAPLYRTTEGVLGFIRYDLVIGEAQGVFEKYDDIATDLYDSVAGLTGLPITNIGLWDAEDSDLRGEPSVERSIVSEQESSSNTTFEVHAGVGDLLTISGSDFGTEQGSVLFPDANSGGRQYIAALPHQILEWSDNRIVLELPYRSGTGKVRIDKADGESIIGAEDLPIGYDHINVQYTDGSGRRAYETQLIGENGNGGYDFQFESGFAENTDASEAFVSLIETWACATGVNFQIGEVTTVDEDARDGINIVRFDNGEELGGRTLAYARSRYRGCYQGDTIKWFVDEIEVVVNDDYNWYYGNGIPSRSQFDFETVMLHEIGHTQQLGHVINGNEVMHFAVGPGQQKRALSHIDTIGGEYVTAKSTDELVCGRDVMQDYGACCETMVIATQPIDQTLCPDANSANFTFDVNFAHSWQWQVKNGGEWADVVDGTLYTGATTESLTVQRHEEKSQEFRCLVSNECKAEVTSETVRVVVRDLNILMTDIPATCDANAMIQLSRNDTYGTLLVSINGGSSYDTQWLENESQIDIDVVSGSYDVVVTDSDSACAINLGAIQIEGATALALSAESIESTDCSVEGGSIRVHFNDHPYFSTVRLSLDNGLTFDSFDDTIGSVLFESLEIGVYNIVGTWEDASCQKTLAPIALPASPSDCKDTVNGDTEIPETPETPEIPDAGPDTPETPETPDNTDMPGTPSDSNDTDGSNDNDTPDDPTITDDSEPADAPKDDNDADSIEVESETIEKIALRIYPNPTSERIYLKSCADRILRLQLFNAWGVLVQDAAPLKENKTTYYIDVTHPQAGVYYLKIITERQNLLRQVIIK